MFKLKFIIACIVIQLALISIAQGLRSKHRFDKNEDIMQEVVDEYDQLKYEQNHDYNPIENNYNLAYNRNKLLNSDNDEQNSALDDNDADDNSVDDDSGVEDDDDSVFDDNDDYMNDNSSSDDSDNNDDSDDSDDQSNDYDNNNAEEDADEDADDVSDNADDKVNEDDEETSDRDSKGKGSSVAFIPQTAATKRTLQNLGMLAQSLARFSSLGSNIATGIGSLSGILSHLTSFGQRMQQQLQGGGRGSLSGGRGPRGG